MTAPTGAEIRETIEDTARLYDSPQSKLAEAIDKALDAIAYIELDADDAAGTGATVISELWNDLRPSEATALSDLIHGAREELNETLWPQIVLVATEAALRFAKKYPNAPRAEREAVTAS